MAFFGALLFWFTTQFNNFSVLFSKFFSTHNFRDTQRKFPNFSVEFFNSFFLFFYLTLLHYFGRSVNCVRVYVRRFVDSDNFDCCFDLCIISLPFSIVLSLWLKHTDWITTHFMCTVLGITQLHFFYIHTHNIIHFKFYSHETNKHADGAVSIWHIIHIETIDISIHTHTHSMTTRFDFIYVMSIRFGTIVLGSEENFDSIWFNLNKTRK